MYCTGMFVLTNPDEICGPINLYALAQFVGFEVESLNYGKAGSVQVEIIHKQEQSDYNMTNLSNLEVD